MFHEGLTCTDTSVTESRLWHWSAHRPNFDNVTSIFVLVLIRIWFFCFAHVFTLIRVYLLDDLCTVTRKAKTEPTFRCCRCRRHRGGTFGGQLHILHPFHHLGISFHPLSISFLSQQITLHLTSAVMSVKFAHWANLSPFVTKASTVRPSTNRYWRLTFTASCFKSQARTL